MGIVKCMSLIKVIRKIHLQSKQISKRIIITEH